MNSFNRIKKNILAFLSNHDGSGINRWMGLAAVVLLLLSVVLTVQVLRLQQEIRQRASDKCVENPGAACNNNNKACCSGMTCVLDPDKENGQGKCELVPTSIPPTEVPPTSVPPTAIPPTSQPNPTVYVAPTVPLYPTVTEAPTPTPESGIGGTSGETETLTSTPTPTSGGGGTGATPTPIPVQCGPNGCGSSGGGNATTNAPGVQICTTTFNGPKQLIGTRLSPTSIRFNWWPAPGGADNQLIQYGLESGKPQWGLMKIAGDQGQIMVNNLPANKTIWAQVRAYRGNCYEDTGWVSVNTSYQASNTTTIRPTSGLKLSALHAATPTPKAKNTTLVGATFSVPGFLTLVACLLLFGYIFRKNLFLLLFKKRRKKKDE